MAGGGDGLVRAFADVRCRDARPLEIGHVDESGIAGAGRGVKRRDELRPLLVVDEQLIELGLQVGRRVAGHEAGRERRPADQSAAAGADRLRVARGFPVDVARDPGGGQAGVAVRDQEGDDRTVVLGEQPAGAVAGDAGRLGARAVSRGRGVARSR